VTFIARAVVAVSLLLAVYVLAAGVVAAISFAIYEGMVHGLTGFLLGKGAALLLVVTLALARALWAVRRARRTEPTGIPLRDEDQPRLWEEVRSLAEAVGTRAPDEIRLTPQVNASVWEDSRLLGLVAGRRILTVGVPLVLGLTRQQLRAVLAHELGHYSHGDTALAPVIYRGLVTLAHVTETLGQNTLTGKVFAAYGRLYLRLTRSLTRRQEMEADGWSHRVAGRSASAGAMRAVPALDELWVYFLEEYAFPVPGARPDAFFAGFEKLLASPERQREMEELNPGEPDGQSPYDTHPSPWTRLQFFDALPEDGMVDDGAPASELFSGLDAALRQLESQMFARAELEPRPWSWLAETAGIQRARANAAMLVRAMDHPGSGAATLEDALRALARDDSRSLVRPLVAPDTPPGHVDAVARALVKDAIGSALVEHCGARFTVDWDNNDALVDPEGQPIDVAGLVTATVERRSADVIIQALEAEGVPPWFAVDPATVDAQAARGRDPVVHSVAACVSWRRMRILVVSDLGLIVKRLGFGEGFAAALRHGGLDPYRTAVQHVASMPLPQLLEDRRASAFSWDRVGHARVSGTRLALALNGKNHRMRVQAQAVAGDLVGSLHQQLGERLTIA
jgi:Zn-dependent protease with chaperone function